MRSGARRGLVVAAATAATAAAVTAAWRKSPWPSALAVRAAFTLGARRATRSLARHVPEDVTGLLDERYAPGGREGLLDVWLPAEAERNGEALPTVVWVHGGGWVAGDKSEVANYLRVLAGYGYTVVGVNYPIAPRATYPAPTRRVNDALRHLVSHARRLHVDPARIVLAGDSAGAHIAAQVAAITTVPGYAELIGIEPSLAPEQLRATLLHCGPYDPGLVDLHGTDPGSVFTRTVLRAYLGTEHLDDDPRLAEASLADHVTPAFPPTMVTGGNGDPLTPQGRRFAAALAEHGVEVEALFFDDDYLPRLLHEYQFDLDTDEGKAALEATVTFLSSRFAG